MIPSMTSSSLATPKNRIKIIEMFFVESMIDTMIYTLPCLSLFFRERNDFKPKKRKKRIEEKKTEICK